jgi:hypothetical protein
VPAAGGRAARRSLVTDLCGPYDGRLLQAAIRAAQDGKPDRGEQLWQQIQAIWSLAWSANYAALKFMQDAGLSRFSPVRPQRWVAASFEHHRGPHGHPHPQLHNIVITTRTTGAR